MDKQMFKVIYLSSPLLIAAEAQRFLKTLDCDCVFSEGKLEYFPEKYDLGISFLYTYKIPAEQLTHTWINFHPAPLPKYRGRNVAYRAIINKEENFGGTIHYMDATYDTGEIIEVEEFPILEGDTAGDLTAKAHMCLYGLFKKYVPRFINGEFVPSFPQIGGTYYTKTHINDLIDLNKDQERLVRAITYHPNFHAKVKIGGKMYEIIPMD